MTMSEEPDKTTAGAAALSICESLLIALNDLKIIDDKQTRGVLEDAAQTHRAAAEATLEPQEHLAIAKMIDRITAGENSVRKF